jgi:putative inorganic carbon (HCO3(-)) transporter
VEIAAVPARDQLRKFAVPAGTLICVPFLLFPSRLTLYIAPLAIATLVFALVRLRADARFPRPDDLFVAALAALGLVATLISVAPSLSTNRLMGLYAGLLLYYGTQEFIRSADRARQVLEVVVLAGLAISLFAFVGVDWDRAIIINPIPGLYELFPRLLHGLPGSGVPRSSDLIGPREIGGTLSIILPVALVVISLAQSRPRRAVYAVAGLLSLLVLVLTQTFLGWFATLGATILLGVLIWPQATRRVAAGVAGAALAAAILLGALTRFAYLEQIGAFLQHSVELGQRVSDHLGVTALAIPMIRDTPWTGPGMNAFPVMATCYYPPPRYPAFWLPHAHDVLVQTWLDFGLFGLLAFLALGIAVLTGFARRWRAYRGTPSGSLYAAALCGLVAYALFGIADAIPLGGKPGIIVWVLLAAVRSIPFAENAPEEGERSVGIRESGTRNEQQARLSRRKLAAAALGLLVLLLLVGGLLTGSVQQDLNLVACRLNGRCPPVYCVGGPVQGVVQLPRKPVATPLKLHL